MGPPGAGTLDAATRAQLEADFSEATDPGRGPGDRGHRAPARHRQAGALVVDRAGWVRANVSSFRRLLEPVLEKLDAGGMQGPLAGAARRATGAQLGLVLGWMSTRVLGQYDLLLAEGEDTGGVVSYVGPNIVALEQRHGFSPEQFRLWIALHEVTHRCQFTGVPWLRPYFLSLVDQAMSGMTPDPRRFAEALRRAAAAVRAGHNPLEEAGMLGLVAPPEQLEMIGRIQAMMSLLEGHGDITMDRAGADAVPDAALFSRVLRERRRRASLPVAPAPAARRDRGQDAPVRGGGALHPRRRGLGRPGAAGPGVGGARDASHHGRDPPSRHVGGTHRTCPPRRRLMSRPEATASEAVPTVDAEALLGRCTFPSPGCALTCAVSGGPDSLALLALAIAAGCEVTAVHVDHGLRAGSAAEGEVVAAAAARLGARFRACGWRSVRGRTSRPAPGDARRAALPPGSATGHTMDDQAETVFVNLLRGAGLDGLAGMRPGPAHPLLGLRRSETHALCAALGLEPVDDPSNVDRRFVRNRVRHELLPLASAVAGRDLVPVLARQAALLADEADLLEELAAGIDPADAKRAARGAGPPGPPRRAPVAAGTGAPSPRPGGGGAGAGRRPGPHGGHRRCPGDAGATLARGAVFGADRTGVVR